MKVLAAFLTLAVAFADYRDFQNHGNENGKYTMEIFQCGMCPYVRNLSEEVRRVSFEVLNGDV